MGLATDAQSYYENSNQGTYQFTVIQDIINSFMVSYVGEDKLISKIKRSDIVFHAMRGIQEFSFDTFPSTKAIEEELGPALSITLPHDYVNYTKISWIDDDGIERIIYPTSNTTYPINYLKDSNGDNIYDKQGSQIYTEGSTTLDKFTAANTDNNFTTTESEFFNLYRYGNRFGGSPEQMQTNGVFFIDQTAGVIRFSSDLANKLVVLRYISDGLGHDEDMKVHKFAEDAIYKYIAYAILSRRANVPEYQVARFKKEMIAAKRNAKLRMSNLKLTEMAQVLRNQAKWIKH